MSFAVEVVNERLMRHNVRPVKVFMCYSRAQFYLAEDLALALRQEGIDVWFDVHRLRPGDDWDHEIAQALHMADCLVLVASRDALDSVHVGAELDLARELKKPVVVGLAEDVALPGALADAPRASLGKRFEHNTRSLAERLRRASHEAAAGVDHAVAADRAAVVRTVSALLLATALLWWAAAAGLLALGLSVNSANVTAFTAVAVALVGAFCAWLWWAFAHRRPGSGTVLGVAFAYGAPVGTLLAGLTIYVLIESGNLLNGTEVAAVAAIVGCLVAWLGTGAWALQSPALYRWLATGDAPGWMRRRMLARRGQGPAAEPSPGACITYDIRCDELDRSVELALDDALQAAGHRRVKGDEAEREILVLTNLTPISGLTPTLAQLGGRAVVVIASPISLAPIDDVERFQWVDHRRRNRRTLERLAATIGGAPTALGAAVVPESLTRRVVPLAVLATGALCVIIGAVDLATGIAGLAGADIGAIYGASHSLPRTLAAGVLGAVAVWTAIALLGRRLPLRFFLACFATVFILTLATPWLLSGATWAAWAALPSTLVGVVVLLVCGRSLAAWLPPRGVRGRPPTLALDGPAWWRRPVARAVVVYTAAVTLLLLASILPVASSGGVPRATAYADALMAANRYSAAVTCLQTQPDNPYCKGTADSASEAEQSWRRARSELDEALDAVYEHGSGAGADAARDLEATIPSSVEDAQRREFDYAPLLAFTEVACRELNAGTC